MIKASLIILIAVLFLILVITFPLPFNLRVCFDGLKNSGTASCYFLFLRIFLTKISVQESGVLLKINHKKTMKHYVIDKKKLIFINHLTKNLYKYLAIRNLYLATRLGLCDAFYSPIICSAIEAVIGVGLLNMKNKKPHSEISYACSQTCNDFHLAACMSARCFVSVWDVVRSVIKAKIYQKRELKNAI